MIRVAALGTTLVALLAWASVSRAEIYRWVDGRGVANYSEGIDSVPEPYRGTAVPIGLRNAPPAPPAVAGAGPAAGGKGSAEIKFTPGREIVVEATINGTTSVKLLLDTGAQKTVINPRVLASAGVGLRGGQAMQLRGATGTANAAVVQVDSLAVGAAKVEHLFVVSHDVEQEGMDGLLGRDFLDQFKVAIDNQDGVVTLGPK